MVNWYWLEAGHMRKCTCATTSSQYYPWDPKMESCNQWAFLFFFSRLVENKHKTICLDHIYYGAVAENEREATCRTNRTLFVLIGNPGVVWHSESDQCVHTKLYTKIMSNGSIGVEGKIVIFFLFCSVLNSQTCVGGETYWLD
jgi:hypothetical protein